MKKWRLFKFSKNEDREAGGIVLEAAITLPFFLAFVLALITVVKIVSTEIALQAAVTETVKQTAHHYAPVYMVMGKATHEADELVKSKGIPDFIRTWLNELVKDTVSEKVYPLIFTPVARHAAWPLLDEDRLQIVSVKLPKNSTVHDAYVEMVAEYRLPIVLPFYSKELVLQKTASERAWIGGR